MLSLQFTEWHKTVIDGLPYKIDHTQYLYHERSSLPASGESQWLYEPSRRSQEYDPTNLLKPLPFKLRLNFTSEIEIEEERLLREVLGRNCPGLPPIDMHGWLADDLEGWDNHEHYCPFCFKNRGDVNACPHKCHAPCPDCILEDGTKIEQWMFCQRCDGSGTVRESGYSGVGNVRMGDLTPADLRRIGVKHDTSD